LVTTCGASVKVAVAAEVEWKEIWRDRSIADADQLKTTYACKKEILALIAEQARPSGALEQAEEQLRIGAQEQERIDDELALHRVNLDLSFLSGNLTPRSIKLYSPDADFEPATSLQFDQTHDDQYPSRRGTQPHTPTAG